VRHITGAVGERGPDRGSHAARLTATTLAVGLAVAAIATAAPVGANEPMKTKLHKLRICESGNNYREDTGNGYYGAYQFSSGTWRSLGFRGRPDHAKHATQDRAARKEHRIDGWRAWPACSAAEHLR
jgi:resuscitation-promoting factor RpfA